MEQRIRIRCEEHLGEEVTNFCYHHDCLKPLCPDCVQQHTKAHDRQLIQSWKNVINKSSKTVKKTLAQLRELQSLAKPAQSHRSVQVLEDEAIKKLSNIKFEVMQLVEDMFAEHEKSIRQLLASTIRSPVDLSKLKMAIEQIQKLSNNISIPGSTVKSLRKIILLDHQSLIKHFENQLVSTKHKQNRIEEVDFDLDVATLDKIKHSLSKIIAVNKTSRQYQAERQNYKVLTNSIEITQDDYFVTKQQRNLHFFIPFTNELKILNLRNLKNPNWKTIQLNLTFSIPSFSKSISLPDGSIYLIGGSQRDTKLNTIYRYSEKENTLVIVGKMLIARSSHAICHSGKYIYILGGYKNKSEMTRECEVFNVQNNQCTEIAKLNFASANGCVCSFNKSLVKIGGTHAKQDSESKIQIYDINTNRWTVIDPDMERFVKDFHLLSFSACVQINSTDIFVFGGYEDTEEEASSSLSYVLRMEQRNNQKICYINSFPLLEAEGFWENNPLIDNRRVLALQNIPDNDGVSSLVDCRRIVVFDGIEWNQI